MFNFIVASLLLLTGLTGHAQTRSLDTKQGKQAEQELFKVIGYQASWTDAKDIDYSKLTHINYSFAKPNPDGTLEPLANPDKLKKIVELAGQKGVKVGIAVGGWNGGDDSAFETFAATISARKKFIDEILKLVKTYQLDGVDLDWEYPDAGASAIHFSSLVTELSVALKEEGKYLSIAVVSYGKTGEAISKEIFGHIDMLNVMAYDGKDHGSYEQAEKAINYWKERGCPDDKIILGLPFYGRSPQISYRDLLAKDAQAFSKDMVGEVRYNGIAMIKKKTKLAMISCGGVMIWELSQDASPFNAKHSLLKAVHDAVKETTVE